jgi:octaprenyl-diphosphate synthase
MSLEQIYGPIERELSDVDHVLGDCLKDTAHRPILRMGNYLSSSKGKRMRPAMMLLCAKAAGSKKLTSMRNQLVKVAAAVELIHMASLIHDDIIDHARLRHHKLTMNCRFGSDASMAMGDYLYSIAFQLISGCGNADILGCISAATKGMCEGELLQVLDRDNPALLKQRYLMIVKKKTALLFAASCQTGAMIPGCSRATQAMFKEYGLNFGIAFQIADDCLDLTGDVKSSGKSIGSDFRMGELTLPLLNLISGSKDKEEVFNVLRMQDKERAFKDIKKRFLDSGAYLKTQEDIKRYIVTAKRSLYGLKRSRFKDNLYALADYLV